MTHTLDLLIHPGTSLGSLLVALVRATAVLAVTCLAARAVTRRPRTAAGVLAAGVAGAVVALGTALLPALPSPVRLPIPRPDLPGGRLDATLVGVWVVGVAIVLARARSLDAARRRLWRGAGDAAPELLCRVDREWGPGSPDVRVAPVAGAMLVSDGRRPRLLVDPAALDMDDAELRAVVAHERDHARWRDATTRRCAVVAAALLWPTPLVHLARRMMVAAQEAAADHAALGSGLDVVPYARLLCRIACGEPRPELAPSMGASRDLPGRIRALGRHRGPNRFVLCLALTSILGTLVGSCSVRAHWRVRVHGDPAAVIRALRR